MRVLPFKHWIMNLAIQKGIGFGGMYARWQRYCKNPNGYHPDRVDFERASVFRLNKRTVFIILQ